MSRDFKDEDSSLQRFVALYSSLNKDNLASLADVYAPEVIFEDPAHRIEGYSNLLDYFESLYSNVQQCNFIIDHALIEHDVAYLSWKMQLAHPKLAKGKLREVMGCTQLKFDNGLVIYHRDYFDLGAMLYEALPILGSIIQHIKARLGQ